ncbi:uncharacterized protein [Rutidosis leptorrhynchoides]|uniref:uncharacterized protein n=1 Tax=Rutidosis leptorrhynchoides TaxID=125765 RepID=UPI003A99BF72
MEVEMDVSGHHHHQQDMSSQTLESMLVCTKAQQDKKPRPPEEALKCPRCDSSNTKFCYYNNYSLTQPRYFCKSCRRYWTKGGTLRNVPVGGGCRKNKRSSSSSSATSSATSSSSSLIRRPQDHPHQHLINQHHPLNLITSSNNNSNSSHLLSSLTHHLPYDSTCTDLSLAFARLQSQANGHMGGVGGGGYDQFDHSHDQNGHDQLGFLDAIRGGFLENTNNFHNVLYNGSTNIGNGDMGGGVGNLMGLNNDNNNNNVQDHQESMMNNSMFHDHHHQESMMNNNNNNGGGNGTTCVATSAVTMTTVKQETCNMMRVENGENGRLGGGVLWGFPWQMGAGGGGDQGMNMVHEVDSGRSQIGGWNGIGSTNWHGLVNSPLM